MRVAWLEKLLKSSRLLPIIIGRSNFTLYIKGNLRQPTLKYQSNSMLDARQSYDLFFNRHTILGNNLLGFAKNEWALSSVALQELFVIKAAIVGLVA